MPTEPAHPAARLPSPKAPSGRGQTAPRRLRLGTRASVLARWQADWVAAALAQLGVPVELVHVSTHGDVSSRPLGAIGGQGVFTKELQRALLDGAVDLAVHSLKDLPTERPAGLALAAVPERESVRDVLVSHVVDGLDALPPGARIGTGSSRRRAQLLHARPDLQVSEIRGNVDTRLRKLDEGQYEAIVLAEAGLKRLGLSARITQILPLERMLPAVGQGALGVEARRDDDAVLQTLTQLDHPGTRWAVLAERALLAALDTGCLAPVGAWARVQGDGLQLDAVVLSPDGRERLAASSAGPPQQAESLGRAVAAELLARGASQLIAASRRSP
ncbi:MAG: hydroxymethylbilane synthase [Candidatus Anammoximicrobium sp.]|nr:hydroxymethylbilane synthase [Candidatus Anammoximicrobium sp.]